MKLRDYVEAVAATVLAILAGMILAKTIWEGWDYLVLWLVSQGAPEYIGGVLAVLIFLAALYLGVIQLKKFKN